jgi:hypothetical protein
MKAETWKLPQARHDELFVEQMDEELLVYDAKYQCAHRLNATAAWVWRRCDGQRSVQEATQMLSDELQRPLDEELVWLSLDTLDQAHLLLTPIQRPHGAIDDSRRALIQKLAYAGGLMFLLPAITPLTRAAQADSPLRLSVNDTAITASSKKGAGIWAFSEGFEAMHADTKSPGFAGLGAFVTKTITRELRAGNPLPRVVERAGGLTHVHRCRRPARRASEDSLRARDAR